MADLTIPGVNSQYGTDKMIEGLMKLERIPLTRKEEQIETYEKEKETWQSLNRQLSLVRKISRELFGFQNPFGERIASSSSESIVTATAKRDAVEESRDVTVIQTASADRFVTRELDPSRRVDQGLYLFKVGEKEIPVRFRGGTLSEFSDLINRKGKGYLKASTVKNRPDSQIFVLTSLKEGKANQLTFEEDALPWALEAGIIEEKPSQAWSTDTEVTVDAKESEELPVGYRIPQEGSFLLELTLDQKITDPGTYVPPTEPKGPSTPDPGSLTLDGITIRNAESEIELPPWEAPPVPPFEEDRSTGVIKTDAGDLPLPSISDIQGKTTLTMELPPGTRADSVIIVNNNTHRTWSIQGARIYDPDQRDGYTPVGAVSTARDAKLQMDGIDIIRSSNNIEDLIPGLTLNLHRSSPEPVTLTVEPDREAVTNKLIEFVFTYNKTVEELQILTSTDPSVITELSYMTDDEKAAAKEKLGSFQGDLTLMQMKSRLQTIVTQPQTTSLGREMTLLSQIGISTNTQGLSGGGYDVSKMRGYLEIDEKSLNQALETSMEAVKELCGRDSDGDFVVDAGIGYHLDNYAKTFTQQGGLLSSKISSIDSQIDRTEREILSLKDKLEDKEFELKRKYGMMEGSLRNLEKNSDTIENFNRQNSGD